MATKLVSYLTDTCLPCACKGTANVILCTIFQQTVPAQLIASTQAGSCENAEWNHQFQYDSVDLPAGVTALATSDITGVICEGCMVTWVREQLSLQSNQVVSVDEQGTLVEFGAAVDGDTEDFELEVTNPSDTQELVGVVDYNFIVDVQSITAFSAGVSTTFYADGLLEAGKDRAVYWAESNPNGIDILRAGASCRIPYTIPPGESRTFRVRFRADVGTLPSTEFFVSSHQLAFFGVTQPV